MHHSHTTEAKAWGVGGKRISGMVSKIERLGSVPRTDGGGYLKLGTRPMQAPWKPTEVPQKPREASHVGVICSR